LCRSRLLCIVIGGGAIVALAVGGIYLLSPHDDSSPTTTWEAYREASDGLIVYSLLRSCDEVTGVDVVERDDRVDVTVQVAYGGVCGDLAVENAVRANLAEPLAGRPVRDGACLTRGLTQRECLRDEVTSEPSGGPRIMSRYSRRMFRAGPSGSGSSRPKALPREVAMS
jgi:hypothetical protein